METFHTAEFDSSIGPLKVASSKVGLAYVELPRASGRGFRGWLEKHSPGAQVVDDRECNRIVIDEILEFLIGRRREFSLPLDLRGTPFQEAVYAEVLRIPYGESRSYAQIAQSVGRPKAVRAVGAANGANPIPLIVPCHRVIGSNGHLQGYAGGLETKARLLALEGSGSRAGCLF